MAQAQDWIDSTLGRDSILVLALALCFVSAAVAISRGRRLGWMQKENAGLCASLRAATGNVATLRETVTEAQASTAAHKATADAQRHSMSAQRAQVEALSAENMELRRLTGGVRNDLLAFQARFDALDLRRRSLEAELSQQHDRNMALQDEVNRLRSLPRNRRSGHLVKDVGETLPAVILPLAGPPAPAP